MTPRTAVASTCLAFTTALLVGCGSEEKDAKAESSPTDSASASASESASPSPSATSSLSPEELQAKVVVNAAPKDLVWLVPQPPASWRKLQTPTGTTQWQIGDEPCVVTVSQPAGVGPQAYPNSEQALDREIKKTGEGVKAVAAPKTTKDAVMVRQQVVGLDATVSTKFPHARVDYGKGTEADIRAYRAGDFALIAAAVCGESRLKPVLAGGVSTFLEGLAARTTY